jgi:hypothetical protein
VLPVLALGLAAGLFVLMLLRRYWSQAREGFLSELKQVESELHEKAILEIINNNPALQPLLSGLLLMQGWLYGRDYPC